MDNYYVLANGAGKIDGLSLSGGSAAELLVTVKEPINSKDLTMTEILFTGLFNHNSRIQSNFSGSNTFRTMKISWREG